jgi:phosphoribosylanthranilate isomerase
VADFDPPHLFVKVCGLRTQPDVAAAVAAGADAIGFVLTPSPRQAAPADVRRLVDEVPPAVLTVGVFRGEPVEVVREAVRETGVGAIQLHGDEPAGHFAALGDLGLPLIRATSPAGDLRNGSHGEDLLLVDSPQPGSGTTWEWTGLAGSIDGPWLLAGGLNPGNVGAAIEALRPWGVDVSSGVEASRGVKDPDLIRAFLSAARTAEAKAADQPG